MKAAELYDVDFAEWARQNAELLRSGRVSEADLAHIAEEIEDLGKRQRHSLYRHMVRLMEHLLKWQYQPERRGGSWQRTIYSQREDVKLLLEENPSFAPEVDAVIAKAYLRAAKEASLATKRSRKDFPTECPYTLEQLLDEQFLPSAS